MLWLIFWRGVVRGLDPTTWPELLRGCKHDNLRMMAGRMLCMDCNKEFHR